MNRAARVVLLNGVGSSGKSSIAKALQGVTTDPFLHVQMDVFIEMLPDAYQNHPDGFAYETEDEQGKPSVIIRTGLIGERTLRGMRHAVVAMAEQGNNLIVDDVLIGPDKAEYAALLSRFEFLRVGVIAPLDVVEQRERQRGDRLIGLARWQYQRVHEGMAYDLEVDTASLTPIKCAELIKERFGL